ncbi:hypothetical protein B5M42_002930 [Paenibacillus athensensis]|uniref:Uncharacterized protein n=1 Tax=Paenibacillus athensensis TaxID=1967502 RepID=A0A4Y8QAS3_9BACL|nr:hypothetical protein [Paenibacillus athensensis]MCD1257795.1 hypothetical protein [Paenibacillus athensensis]
MIGTLRINGIVAALAGLFTFALSVGNNLFLTTCLKSFYSFAIVFVLTFGFRWVMGAVAGMDRAAANPDKADDGAAPHVGGQLDLATPEDDEATRQMLKQMPGQEDPQAGTGETQFSPLNPPKLVTKNNLDPEQLAGALRRLSED